MPPDASPLTVPTTPTAHRLLKDHDFPGCEGLLARATATGRAVLLTGPRAELEALLGWVAGEANALERRGGPHAATWAALSDALEGALAAGRG